MILLIGISYAIMGFFMPPLGDDLGFYHTFTAQNDCWYALPRSMYRHWIWNNARIADMITPIGLNIMPLWLRAISNGIITAILLYIILRFSIKNIKVNYLQALMIISIIAFTFRWDAIWMEFCATYNYVWSATLSLTALYFITYHKSNPKAWYWWLCIPFCFVAAGMHEACGFPLAAGCIVYLIVYGHFHKENLPGKLMGVAFISGGIFTLTSPASYSRVGSMLQPESPIEMLLFSAGYVIILTFIIIFLAFCKKVTLKSLLHSPWTIFVCASYLSTGFMLLSQYGGRTGWFAQTFALIAIFQIITKFNIHIPKYIAVTVTAILCLGIISHYYLVTYWQIRLGNETRKAISLYQQSADGIIFMDYTNEPDLPWYLLRKTHGVPDDDDSYYRYRMSKHYGKGFPLIILPEAARELDWRSFSGIKRFGDRFISDKALAGSYDDRIVDIFPRTMILINGIEYIETPFKKNDNKFYLYSSTDRDPGEK